MAAFVPARFVAEAIAGHDEVSQAEAIDDTIVEVQRKKHPPFVVAAISESHVERAHIEDLACDKRIDMIVNIPREAAWTGEAIDFVRKRGVAFGGVKDLFSAAGRPEPIREYVRKEFEFVERIFRQHTAVDRVARVFDRVYRLKRLGRPDVTVVLINEYDLTADHVRVAWDRYGPFTDILANNPNCRFTDEAVEAAKQLKVKLMPLGQFMGRLNNE